jgi:hypothetical protein
VTGARTPLVGEANPLTGLVIDDVPFGVATGATIFATGAVRFVTVDVSPETGDVSPDEGVTDPVKDEVKPVFG